MISLTEMSFFIKDEEDRVGYVPITVRVTIRSGNMV